MLSADQPARGRRMLSAAVASCDGGTPDRAQAVLDEAAAYRDPRHQGAAQRLQGRESWLRLSRSGPDGVENLGGWLTTVAARVCLDMLRSRTSRREEPLDAAGADPVESAGPGTDPEHAALLADSVGLARRHRPRRHRPRRHRPRRHRPRRRPGPAAGGGRRFPGRLAER